MKKVVFALLVIGLILPGMGLFASSLDYLTNQSAKWFMTPTRNAATDAADIVNFNPAGTVFLPQGWNIDVSNQTLFKWYGNDTTVLPTPTGTGMGLSPFDESLDQDLPTWYLPNIYMVYNMGQQGPGKLALYGQLGITAGGGNLEYKDGTAGSTFALNGLKAGLAAGTFSTAGFNMGYDAGAITSQSFKASSIYYNIAVGGAYSLFDDMASVSLGGRFLIPRRSLTFEASYATFGAVGAEYEYNAYGFTPIVGFDVKPLEGLTLSLRYEFETALEFEYSKKRVSGASAGHIGVVNAFLTSNGISDGKKFNQNLPHSVFLGAEYDVTKDLTVSLSGNMFMLSIADLGETTDGKQVNDFFGTGWEIGIGATYKVIEALKLGFGVFYTETGAKDSYFNDQRTILNVSANPTLDSIAFGAGGTYSFKSGVDLTLSALYCHYLPLDYSVTRNSTSGDLYTVSGTYSKDVFAIGIGVGYKY
jgi:long-subunit fatty acid transport protein